MNIKKWNFWNKVKRFTEKQMHKAWMEGGNCDSCCTRCNQWESLGNIIQTESLADGSEKRKCGNCGKEWIALFTPAGFVEVK